MKTEWEIRKIEDICDKASSNIAQNKIEGISGCYPVYGASGYVQNVDFYHMKHPYIGIVKDGSGVGRVNVYPPYSSLLGTMQYIIPKQGCNLGYLAYALKSLKLSSFAAGAAIPHIYFRDYGKCKIPVPPIAEQERIVGELDLLSGIIDKQKAQLRELDTLAQSIFYDMFGDPIINEKGWHYSLFKDTFRLKSGDNLTEKEFNQGEYPVYGGNGISGYHSEFNKEGKYIIIGRVGAYCGNVRYVQGRFWLTDNAFETFFDIDVFDYQFVCALLNSINLHQFANHAAQPVISNTGLKDIKIIVPPIELQNTFAEKIENIERQKELIKQSISDTEALFNSRMDYYFD